MTNIKAKGFDSPAQLREHLDDVDEKTLAPEPPTIEPVDNVALQKEIAWLRKDVADLSEQAKAMRRSTQPDGRASPFKSRPIISSAATVAATFVLRRLLKHVRLGTRWNPSR